ncbi:hypothetical protein LSCM1_08110 [Leishmania martiniquensis]|uniref:Uncharacterized protein n=1 Tax=Leishmania martiniquensis TaxID=1580590 RepID=A0A836KUK8_9TRYP|nr:hypothetical protein LSCM1_08110 [Leishmania martiniquensis]
MPTKAYIQRLQRLFVYFQRNGGRHVPQGVAQIALVDDDDLTRWFVQLRYSDENSADFYVSLELVFSEDGDDGDGVVGGAWGEKADVEGVASVHRSVSPRHPEQSTSASMLAVKLSAATTHADAAAPQSYAATSSSPHALRHHARTANSSTTPAQQSSSAVSEDEGDETRADAAHCGCREETPKTETRSPSGGSVACMRDQSTERQRSDDDAESLPTTALPQPCDEPQRRLTDRAKPLADAVAFSSAAAATGGSRQMARMPLVFVVAPRLIASFIHHGALCSLELMSQQWELTPENMALLLIALFETLNPFAGDGRVSVDDAERMESRRETAAARGIGGGGASTFAGAYSEEEHQLGMEFIRRAHPHLFRRYVSPIAAIAGAVSDGTTPLAVHLESSSSLGDSAVAVTVSESIGLSASPPGAQTDTTAPSFAKSETGRGRASGSGAREPHVLCEVSHLNTAVYDALVSAYASSSAPSPAPPSPPPSPFPPQQQRLRAETARAAVEMLLDSPALLADAEGVRLIPSGMRGVQQSCLSATAAAGDGSNTADRSTPDAPADRDRDGAMPPSSTSASIFMPAMNAARLLRARPPALSHLVYAPTRLHWARAKSEEAQEQQQQQQRVAELWIPFAMPPSLPSAGTCSTVVTETLATAPAEGHGATQVLLLSEAGVSHDVAAAPFALEVHLIGDAADDVQHAQVACMLRNMRVSASAARKVMDRSRRNGGGGDNESAPTQQPQPSALHFSLQPSTAPSPTGDVHTCRIPHGLTLHCTNMHLYGHLRVFGSLVLDNCVLVGSLAAEGVARVRITRTRLALTPDDRLLQRQPLCCGARRSTSSQRSSAAALPGTAGPAVATDTAAAADDTGGTAAREPPPPALFYAQRKECVLVLDSSRVEMLEGTRIYRLMCSAPAAARGWRRSSHEPKAKRQRGETLTESSGLDEDDDGVGSDGDGERDSGDAGERGAAAAGPPVAVMWTVLRSLILVSNQGRLRLVRCTVHPGRNTERSIFAEQDAIVDMAYCRVTAAISSAVSVQGCRAYLEHCFFEGSPTTIAATTSAVLSSAEGAAAAEGSDDGVSDGGCSGRQQQQQPPPPIRVNDATRCTGLNVELGGTLTARHCTARHLYFAFCVIAHSVAHFYRCHAEDVVNGFTVDASAATLDGCSAHTNHVGAFVLRKAKCVLTEDSRGSFPRRCSLLGEAHETACRVVMRELEQKQREARGGVSPLAVSETESLWSSAAAVAERTARVARLARRHYAEQLSRSDTLSDAAPADTAASDTPLGRSSGASPVPSPRQPLGFFGGRFSLEVRDAALKATGVTLMNARDTSVYAYEDSSVELEECVLWSTAEAEEAASGAAATVAAALGYAESPHTAASATTLKLTRCGAISPLRLGSPRQRSCGIKVVHAGLKARRCLIVGYSFGFAAIQSAQAELQECMVVSAINGYTIDHSQCQLRHCGADTSHVGLFALNGSRVEADSTPHMVGVDSCGRTLPPLICGGVPAVFCGDVYGVESQSSEIQCTGIVVLRGRDSGFNAYNGSVLRLKKCLVDMSPTDAASYVFQRPSDGGGGGRRRRRGAGRANTPDGTMVAAGSGGERGVTSKGDGVGMAGLWTRHLSLDIGLTEERVLCASSSDVDHAHYHHRLAASALRLSDQQDTAAAGGDEGGEDGRDETTRSAGLGTPSVRTSGVKVWSGSQCYAQDTEVRCVTFGFASLGPDTLLDAHHCTAKHVVNGFTSDGGALQLTKCSASSNHVGVYVLSHAHCVVRRGSYAAKKYGIECRSGVLSLQGHVKIYGFSRIGMYLYDGAHCEADPDCVLDIRVLKRASPALSGASSAAVATAVAPVQDCTASSAGLLQLQKAQQQQQQQPQPRMTTSLCSPVDASSVSDVLPACIALDEATAHLPQAVLGGGARCGVTCGDGATGFIGRCIVYDCSLVGVNVFNGAHLTLANALLQCAQQYAVVVHVGGVCRIIRAAEGGEADNDDDGPDGDSDSEGEALGAAGRGGLRNFLRRHIAGAAVSAAARRVWSLTLHVVAMPWRAAPRWAWRRDPSDKATAAAVEPVEGDGGSCRGGAHPAGSNNDEIGGPRTVPLMSAVRQRLRWLCGEALLGAQMSFRLNRALTPAVAVGADGAGPKPGSTAAGVEEWRALRVTPSAPHAAPASRASANAPVLPPIRPAICGSCVVRGTCAMERVLLRPTNRLPRLSAKCKGAGGDDDDGERCTEWGSVGDVAAASARRRPRRGRDDRNSPAQPHPRHTEAAANGTVTPGADDGDSEYVSPLLGTTSTIKAFMAVAEASARAAGSRASLPSVRVLHHLVRQPPSVHVCQQGVLKLTDCIVDVSLSSQPRLGGRCTGQLVSAVVACEGPYAKLHCDYVRVVRGEGGGKEGSGVIVGGDGDASRAPRADASNTSTTPSPFPALLSKRRRATVTAAADVATVPLLLISLVGGAQCALHMVGASLDDWPYCAYTAASNGRDGDDVSGDPMTRAEREDSGALLGAAGRSGAELVPLTAACNAGVMLRTAGDTLAEVTHASITAILASQRSQVRLAHCTVTGMVPIILGSGSYASLTSCRVVGGVRAGPAAAAIRVEHDGLLALFRSSVWTLSQGPAVECADRGRVQAIDSEELTLGTADAHDASAGAGGGGAAPL